MIRRLFACSQSDLAREGAGIRSAGFDRIFKPGAAPLIGHVSRDPANCQYVRPSPPQPLLRVPEPDKKHPLTCFMPGSPEQINPVRGSRLAGHVIGHVGETQLQDGGHLNPSGGQGIAATDLHTRTLPDSNAAGNPARPDGLTKARGKLHPSVCRSEAGHGFVPGGAERVSIAVSVPSNKANWGSDRSEPQKRATLRLSSRCSSLCCSPASIDSSAT